MGTNSGNGDSERHNKKESRSKDNRGDKFEPPKKRHRRDTDINDNYNDVNDNEVKNNGNSSNSGKNERYRETKVTETGNSRRDKERSRKDDRRNREKDENLDRHKHHKKDHRKRSAKHRNISRRNKSGDSLSLSESDSSSNMKKRKRHQKDDSRRKKEKKSKKRKSRSTEEVKIPLEHQMSMQKQGSIAVPIEQGSNFLDMRKLFDMGSVRGKPPDQLLDPERDYFSLHQHFWLYLFRKKHVVFNDLSAEQARDAFAEFVKHYNMGKLESLYYDSTIPSEALDEIKTTHHNWGLRISDRESMNLRMLQKGIRNQTEYTKNNSVTNNDNNNDNLHRFASNNNDLHDKSYSCANETSRIKVGPSSDHRFAKLRDHIRAAEEELTGGRATDRQDRLLEKRREVGAKTHGAAKDREDTSAIGPILSDDVLYGSSESEFQSALMAQKRKQQQREEQKRARIEELQAKEQEKQQAMLQMLGLADKIRPGEKIQIKPRDD